VGLHPGGPHPGPPGAGPGGPGGHLRPAGTRTGQLSLFFLDLAAAQAAEAAHAAPAVWAIDNTGPGAPSLDAYVVSGSVDLHADGPDLTRWVLDVEYTEVVP
jgi:hypothetical protein